MNNNIWDNEISKLADKLIKKPDVVISEQSHSCRVCQNRLEIQIGKYKRGNIKMIGVTIECDECNKAIAMDFIEG